MLRRAAVATVLLAGALTPVAYAADGPGVGNAATCEGSPLTVTVCAEDGSSASGGSGSDDGKERSAGTSGAGSSDAPKCTYTLLVPQPPDTNLAVQQGKKQGGKGAVYQVNCPETGRIGVTWVPDGADPAAPAIDPETVAQRAVDSMKLVGPKVASPRAAGKYVVGMPMWMWADQTPTTFGPSTATATAGGVTVSATAKVSTIKWDMGDDSEPVVCNGPGTKYEPSMGKAASPDCGHVYDTPSSSTDGDRFKGRATARWTVDWQVVGGTGDTGQLTEVRETTFTVDVREVQVLN